MVAIGAKVKLVSSSGERHAWMPPTSTTTMALIIFAGGRMSFG